ncbi:MAG: hypothetical protein ACLR8P_00810 [Clostridium fessum]
MPATCITEPVDLRGQQKLVDATGMGKIFLQTPVRKQQQGRMIKLARSIRCAQYAAREEEIRLSR